MSKLVARSQSWITFSPYQHIVISREQLSARYDLSPAISAACLGQHSIHKRLAVGNEF